MEYSTQNVYQMWFESQSATEDVWITRTTWPGLCARITSVGEPKGPPPYYGNPSVKADVYYPNGQPKSRGFEIPVPGTYKTWRRIATPGWWSQGI